MINFWLLTGCGGFTHKGHQLLFDLLEGVQVVYEEDVSVAGFTGDAHQLTVVSVSKANSKHNVTFKETQRRKTFWEQLKDENQDSHETTSPQAKIMSWF